ncbi:MAG: LysE family translocator [Spirochaetia bacterium]
MPALPTLMLFLLAALGLLLVPGPAVMYIVTRSAAHGRRAGFASVLGVEVASLVHSMAAALGLSALLLASALAFQAVKYVGAAYLVYLGIRTLLSKDDEGAAAISGEARLSRLFAKGLLVNLLNPKTALFFYAFLPQFVDPHKGGVQAQIFLLGILFVVLATCTDGLYSLLASSVGRLIFRSTRVRKVRRYVSAGIYMALGVAAAVSGTEKH